MAKSKVEFQVVSVEKSGFIHVTKWNEPRSRKKNKLELEVHYSEFRESDSIYSAKLSVSGIRNNESIRFSCNVARAIYNIPAQAMWPLGMGLGSGNTEYASVEISIADKLVSKEHEPKIVYELLQYLQESRQEFINFLEQQNLETETSI